MPAAVPRITRACAVCGLAFSFMASKLKYSACRYCSKSCAGKATVSIMHAAVQSRKPSVGAYHPCPHCGAAVVITTARSMSGRYSCGTCWRLKSCRYWRENGPRLRGQLKERRRRDPLFPSKAIATAQIRRARKMSAAIGKVDYAFIRRRDRMRCHLCRTDVLEADLHFDHVIPLSKGGSHSNENISVAHSWCNSSKNNRVLTLF